MGGTVFGPVVPVRPPPQPNGVCSGVQEVGISGYPGGTYKDVRTFEQDLVEVKPGDEVELEVPIVIKDQQPSTSTAHHGLPTSHHSSSSSKPRKAKKSRQRHHSSGHVNGNNQLNMVEPLVYN